MNFYVKYYTVLQKKSYFYQNSTKLLQLGMQYNL